VGKLAITGTLDADVAYVAIGALPSPGPDADALVAACLGAATRGRGLVIDLRPCVGGNETTAQRIAAPLFDVRTVYSRRRFRSGPEPSAFGPWTDAVIEPPDRAAATAGAVVAILGPGCVSSGEGLAQMLETCPRVTTVGRPTRGASGNPAPVPLPGGIDVWTSRWQCQRANGEELEGKGVVPQVPVEATGPGDPALDRALELLRAKLAATAPR
jgi:C-terminal processing protease CtpA/Prc